MTKHEVENGGAKKAKLSAGLKKLSAEQLGDLHDAVGAELKRRAKEAADNKKPSQMSDKEFQTFVAREISKANGDDE